MTVGSFARGVHVYPWPSSRKTVAFRNPCNRILPVVVLAVAALPAFGQNSCGGKAGDRLSPGDEITYEVCVPTGKCVPRYDENAYCSKFQSSCTPKSPGCDFSAACYAQPDGGNDKVTSTAVDVGACQLYVGKDKQDGVLCKFETKVGAGGHLDCHCECGTKIPVPGGGVTRRGPATPEAPVEEKPQTPVTPGVPVSPETPAAPTPPPGTAPKCPTKEDCDALYQKYEEALHHLFDLEMEASVDPQKADRLDSQAQLYGQISQDLQQRAAANPNDQDAGFWSQQATYYQQQAAAAKAEANRLRAEAAQAQAAVPAAKAAADAAEKAWWDCFKQLGECNPPSATQPPGETPVPVMPPPAEGKPQTPVTPGVPVSPETPVTPTPPPGTAPKCPTKLDCDALYQKYEEALHHLFDLEATASVDPQKADRLDSQAQLYGQISQDLQQRAAANPTDQDAGFWSQQAAYYQQEAAATKAEADRLRAEAAQAQAAVPAAKAAADAAEKTWWDCFKQLEECNPPSATQPPAETPSPAPGVGQGGLGVPNQPSQTCPTPENCDELQKKWSEAVFSDPPAPKAVVKAATDAYEDCLRRLKLCGPNWTVEPPNGPEKPETQTTPAPGDGGTDAGTTVPGGATGTTATGGSVIQGATGGGTTGTITTTTGAITGGNGTGTPSNVTVTATDSGNPATPPASTTDSLGNFGSSNEGWSFGRSDGWGSTGNRVEVSVLGGASVVSAILAGTSRSDYATNAAIIEANEAANAAVGAANAAIEEANEAANAAINAANAITSSVNSSASSTTLLDRLQYFRPAFRVGLDYEEIDEALDYLSYCDWAYYNDYEGYLYFYCDEDEKGELGFLQRQVALGWRPDFEDAAFMAYLSDEFRPSFYLGDYYYEVGSGNYLQSDYGTSAGGIEYRGGSYYYFGKPGQFGSGIVPFFNNPVTGYSNPTYDFGPDIGGSIVKDGLWGNYGYLDNPITTPVIGSDVVNNWQAQDNWDYIIGKHQLKAGVNWTYQKSPDVFLPSINSATWPTLPGSGGFKPMDFRQYGTFYYQDNWKVGQNLTLQMGWTWASSGDSFEALSGEPYSTTVSRAMAQAHVGAGATLADDGTVVIVGGSPRAAGVDVFNDTVTPNNFNWKLNPIPSFLTGLATSLVQSETTPQIARETFGFEKTFLSGDASVGLRVPFVQTERRESPLSFRIGGTEFTPSGFPDFENIFRSTTGGGWSTGVVQPFTPYMASGVMIGGKFYGQYVEWPRWGPTSVPTSSANLIGGGSNVIGSVIPNTTTFALGGATSGATFVPPPEWKVVTLQEFLNQLAGSAKPTQTPGSGGGTGGQAEILGPDDLVLRVDAQGRVILARGPWELATLNAAPPFGLESGTASWMALPLPDQLPQVNYRLLANGNSSGEAFELQVEDQSGQFKKVVLPDGVVLEPAAKKDPKAKAAGQMGGQAGNMLKQQITAFCLQFAKLPPEAGMLYKIADPEKQKQHRPAAYVMQAGYELGANGELNPDSDPKAYIDAIRQYAVWVEEEGWDEQQFTEHWIERTRKNAQALNIAWSQQMENALRAAAPNRWRDITKVRERAKAMMQKEASPAF